MPWDISQRKIEIRDLLATIVGLQDVQTKEPKTIPGYPFATVDVSASEETRRTTSQKWITNTITIQLFLLYDDAQNSADKRDDLLEKIYAKLNTYLDPTYAGVIDNRVAVDEVAYILREQPIHYARIRFRFTEIVTLP